MQIKEEPIKQEGNEADSEQKDLYDIFVAQGIKLASVASEKLQGNSSVDLLGNTLFEIVTKIEGEGEKNGIKFGIPVLLHGSSEILSHLIEMSKVEINEEQVKAVVGLAVGKYLTSAMKTGKMSKEQITQMSQEAQQSMPQGAEQPPQQGAPPEQAAPPQGGAPPRGLLNG